MPSPFPGMDPYLEEPGLWPDVHHRLISTAQELLNGQLRPKYFARVEERVYLSDEEDPGRSVLIPDLRIAELPGRHERPVQPGATATLDVPESIVVRTLIDDEIREARLQVIDRQDRRVVTVIEILSPSNKVAGARGRASFQEKRREVMTSGSHWVEIDLLRRGTSPLEGVALPPYDYLVHVSRVEERPQGRAWPIRLPQQLPVVPIPLGPGDPDARLDLRLVLDTGYDRAGYEMLIDYRGDPSPPLDDEAGVWADRLLKEKGFRA